MPIYYDHVEADIIIIKYDGDVTLEETLEPLHKVIAITQVIDPETVHVIYDVRTLGLSFNDFIGYVAATSQRRREGLVPTNMKQYFVGTNHWIESLRTWFGKQHHIEMGYFTDLDAALAFIRQQRKSA